MGISPALAIGLAGGLSAAGSVAGGALARPEDNEPQYSFYQPQTDPVLAGLSLEAMMGLGLDPGIILQQSSPINQIINQIQMNPGMTAEGKHLASKAITNLAGGFRSYDELSEKTRKALLAGLSAAGLTVTSLNDVIAQESQWRDYTQGVLENIRSGQGNVQAGRTQTQQAIANLMSEIAGEFGGGQSPTVRRYMRNLEADINRTYDDRLEDTMRLARVSGFNPGRAIADLEQDRASALRNLQFQGTMQAEQILGLLQGSLAPAQQTAATASGQRTGAGASAAQIAGNQASAINAIQAQTNAQQAQALGAGVGGAFGSLGNAATLYGLLNFQTGGPGTSRTPNVGMTDTGSVDLLTLLG